MANGWRTNTKTADREWCNEFELVAGWPVAGVCFGGLGSIRSINVQSFPPTGAQFQVTTNGGSNPLWSPDGKQLFYLTLGTKRQIMSLDVQTRPAFSFGKTTPLPIDVISTTGGRPYDITPDGKYFLILQSKSQAPADTAPPDQINITLNWFQELQRLVPVR